MKLIKIWILTCSFCTLETAYGLLGWTPSDITDGQPFCDITKLRQTRSSQANLPAENFTSSSHSFFFRSFAWNHSILVNTRGQDSLAIIRKGPRTKFYASSNCAIILSRKIFGYLPVDALKSKKGKTCALTIEPILCMIWSEPCDSL